MFLRPLVAALLVVPALALVAQAATAFRDIPADSWAKRPAEVLDERNILPGRTPIDFAGESQLTRYELAHILSALDSVDGSPSSFIVLKDMPPGHFATLDVQRVLDFKLMATRKPGVFDGRAPVTRQEMVLAMTNLLQKIGIAPPARHANPVVFADVKVGSELGQALDQVVNRYGLIEVAPFSAFRPNQPVTRFQVLDILSRAMPYLNPQIAAAMRAPEPTPVPIMLPGETPTPTPTPLPSGSLPSSFNPSLLHTRALGRVELVVDYDEIVPTDTGLATASEPKEISGSMLAGGGLGGEWWSERLGVTVMASAYYLPLSVPLAGKTYSQNMLDGFFSGATYYVLAGSNDWAAAVGADLLVRTTYDLSPELVNSTYQTADKTYVGAGPALLYGLRVSPSLSIVATVLTYPLLFESYALPSGSKSLTRFAADAGLRAEYALGSNWFVGASGHGLYGVGGGGSQVLAGVGLDLGTRL